MSFFKIFQFRDPSSHSQIIPIVKIVVNIAINNIIEEDHGKKFEMLKLEQSRYQK